MVLLLTAILILPSRLGCSQIPEANVNSRYMVEAVEVPERVWSLLSPSLREEIQKLVGERFNPEALDRLAARLRSELRGYRVFHRIVKGTKPDRIRVIIDVVRRRTEADVFLPRLAYHSKQNFTFGADGHFERQGHRLTFGILTDNDELLERYSGIRGGYQRTALQGRFRTGFLVESYRAQWNGAVQSALAAQPPHESETVPGIYRERLHVSPSLVLEILPGVTLGAGISLQRVQMQFPSARYESSHALTSSLRLRRRWELSGGGKHAVEATYDLRTATHALESDFIYTRHAIQALYRFQISKETFTASFSGGALAGRAPLFERFVLGNTRTLRGYNKYDVAPLGGNRMAHGSLDYRHGCIRVVYDVGAVYDRGRHSDVRHSLAAGLTTGSNRESFSLLVAFPLKQGRAEPIFMVGMNF